MVKARSILSAPFVPRMSPRTLIRFFLMHRTAKLSILMPVFNEQYTVEQAVTETLTARLPDGVTRELIIVDDGSTDDTGDILVRLARKHPEIVLVRQDRNRGKGAAIRLAVEQANGDICIIQDADLEYDPREYVKLMKPILKGDADVVYGSRFIVNRYKRVLYFWHSFGNRLLCLLSNILTNLDLTDMETCYKMVRSDIIKSLPIRCNRFGIEPELTAKFAKRGCRIYEVPISYRGRSYAEGKKITWWDGVKAVFVMIFFWLVDDIYNEKYGHKFLRDLSSSHRFNAWMASAIKPWVGESVLEIGAGMGNITRCLTPRYRYCVSEIDDMHLHYLRNIYEGNRNIEVRWLDVTDKKSFRELKDMFDTVVCLNVLEHIQEDGTALTNIYTSLQPGGHACLLVPRSQRLHGSMDKAVGHCRRYKIEELRRSLEDSGFEIARIFTFNRISAPGWFINGRILRRKKLNKIQLKIFDLFVWLWKLLEHVLPWQGLSIIAIARKRES